MLTYTTQVGQMVADSLGYKVRSYTEMISIYIQFVSNWSKTCIETLSSALSNALSAALSRLPFNHIVMSETFNVRHFEGGRSVQKDREQQEDAYAVAGFRGGFNI